MNNAEKPAHPVQIEDWHGLTKREYFAGLAMQGLLAFNSDIEPRHCAQFSARYADALLAELEK